MPYIEEQFRKRLDEGSPPQTAAELNYTFTKTIIRYLSLMGETYQTYNDIIGSLECCLLEVYRRKTAPYEDKKIKANGDLNT